MKLRVVGMRESGRTLMRRLGYGEHHGREISYERRASRLPFPRFHAYVEEQGEKLTINLHLDAKAPSYGVGSHAHSGEYEGPIIAAEMARIKHEISLMAP